MQDAVGVYQQQAAAIWVDPQVDASTFELTLARVVKQTSAGF
jgi:hypothetical protein